MASEIDIKCQWNRCEASADKHVRFGNRTFGSNDIFAAPVQNFTVLHRNLCDPHVEEVQRQYLEVMVFELGNCRSCAPK